MLIVLTGLGAGFAAAAASGRSSSNNPRARRTSDFSYQGNTPRTKESLRSEETRLTAADWLKVQGDASAIDDVRLKLNDNGRLVLLIYKRASSSAESLLLPGKYQSISFKDGRVYLNMRPAWLLGRRQQVELRQVTIRSAPYRPFVSSMNLFFTALGVGQYFIREPVIATGLAAALASCSTAFAPDEPSQFRWVSFRTQ